MAHSHGHTNENRHKKAFVIGIGLNIAFVIIEVIFGLVSNSSALLADAGHVNGRQDVHEPLNVGMYIRHNQHVRLGIGQYNAAFGHQGCKQFLDFICIRIPQGNELGDDFILRVAHLHL